MEKIELTILRNFLYDEDYSRKALPFIKDEYFQERSEKIVFQEIAKFLTEYNNLPTKEVLTIEVDGRDDISDEEELNCKDLIISRWESWVWVVTKYNGEMV